MNKRLWILGAADPEMTAIERLLLDAGEIVAHATVRGDRVHPGNAYRADAFCIGADIGTAWSGSAVIFVECGGFDDCRFIDADAIMSCDHHRPGDSGYGKPPAEYWTASSLGQVVGLLGSYGAGIAVEDAHLIAAADHCLAAAYRGECPGVDPEALMAWRVKSRAAFQGRPEEDVLADVEAARKALRHAVQRPPSWAIDPDPSSDWPGCDDVAPEYADLRGQHIPELPEAAAREGIAFLASIREPAAQCPCAANDSQCPECHGVGTIASREKVVLQAADADLVQRFLAGTIVPGLVDIYGDPARGFAGGYVR